MKKIMEAPVTSCIIGINTIVLVLGLFLPMEYMFGMYRGALIEAPYRAVTSGFVHFTVLHYVFNMCALYDIGSYMEQSLGRGKYTFLYFVSIIGSSLCINFLATPNSLHAGASGALFGLLAAAIVYKVKTSGVFPYSLVMWLVINIIISFDLHVSWQGHFGGGIAGALIAYCIVRNESK